MDLEKELDWGFGNWLGIGHRIKVDRARMRWKLFLVSYYS
jgi:hypothetical protein